MSEQNIKVIQSRLQQVSLMLDDERIKNQRLILQLSQEKSKVTELQQQIEETYNAKNSSVLGLSLAKQQVTELKLREGTNQRTISNLESKLEESQRERNKLNQKMILMEEEYSRNMQIMKQTLFQKQKELSIKQRQLHAVKSQNLQLQKQTLRLKQKVHEIILKTQKEIRRIDGQLSGFRKQIQSIRTAFLNGIQKQKESFTQGFGIITQKIKVIEISLKEMKQLRIQNLQLKKNIQQLVTQNSRMVIEIYTLKQEEYE